MVKALLEAGKVRVIAPALTGGATLGFDFGEIVAAVAALRPADFYNSSLGDRGSR